MQSVKCFDVVSMVVTEASNRFSPLWKLDEERYDILQQYCEVIDRLSDEFDGESFEVEVDEIAMTVSIKLECRDMVIESKEHSFYDLVERALSIGFSASEDGNLCVTFVFPSVWKRY